MKRKWPELVTDDEAERFVENADLSDYEFADMAPVQFEFEPKGILSESVIIRPSEQ